MAYTPNKRYAALFSGKTPYLEQDVETKVVPAPTGGWDAISPLAAMEPKYAVVLDNWVTRPGWVEIRGGFNAWVQGLSSGAPVESLLVYRPPNGVERLFAAVSTRIYECSSYGIATIALSGLQNARWQYVNFTPALSSSYLLLVNGVDNYTAYDGTTWSNPSISGVSASQVIGINIHKRRVWFIRNQSTIVYFLATDAIAGAATGIDLGALMSMGGFVTAMATWTVDGGNGPDDLAVFITNKGQCIIYKGTDPNNANAWALVGVFDLPSAIGRRCFSKIGSELAIITLQGLLPISQALPFDPSSVRSVAFTNRIQNAMLMAAQNARDNFGWEVITFPGQSLILMNVPVTEGVLQHQYVMNALNGSWCRFIGWNANCMAVFNESLFFGGNDGSVNLAYAGALDLVSPIEADMKCAFNYFDQPGRVKNMSMLRPMLVADGVLTPTLSIDVDFGDISPAATVTIISPSGAVWDVSLWDGSLWAAGAAPVSNWLSVTGLGTALAIRMKVNIAGGSGGGSLQSQSVFDTGVFDTMVFDGNGVITKSGAGVPILQAQLFEAVLNYGGPI